MGINTRMLPIGVTGGTITGRCGSPNPQDVSARFYTAGPGQTIDAQGDPTCDAANLTSQGFAVVCASGSTALRNSLIPNSFKPGTLFLDITLGRVILFDGATWRDVVNGNAV